MSDQVTEYSMLIKQEIWTGGGFDARSIFGLVI